MRLFFLLAVMLLSETLIVMGAFAQAPPYDVFPDTEPPYYRVRYEASTEAGELIFPVSYTVWIPTDVERLRGVVVHQHGCGEGSCKSGLTGAFDLHWQALATKHGCALLAASYEQPQQANCQMWCDPRNGSAKRFLQALEDLAKDSGHPELATVPWALWGHSGGGHWAGGMVMLYPQRVAAAWLRSGVPLLEANPQRADIQPHTLPDAALAVPMMCNLGTKEGVSNQEGRFARVWPANKRFFETVRGKDGLVGIAVDPITAHECGNQRYLAIPWLDTCLQLRLPDSNGQPLRTLSQAKAWYSTPTGTSAIPNVLFDGDPLHSGWLPNQKLADAWTQYVTDTQVVDKTPPPAPSGLQINQGELTWKAQADLESGLAYFVIERDGVQVAQVPEKPKNRFGRPIFQDLQYSDTPVQPLAQMRFIDKAWKPDGDAVYRIYSVNTAGLRSEPSQPAIE